MRKMFSKFLIDSSSRQLKTMKLLGSTSPINRKMENCTRIRGTGHGRLTLLGSMLILAGYSPLNVFAASPTTGSHQGIFVNDGSDNSCSEYLDDTGSSDTGSVTIPVLYNSICQSSDKATQIDRSLFYGYYSEGNGSSAANSLTLGGELYVNAGRLGLSDQANSTYSMVIGSAATLATTTPGQDSIAIGSAQTDATDGASSTATTATGSKAIAVGSAAAATGSDAIALGTSATATSANSVAIGKGAAAGTANSVALGAGSVTKDAVAVSSATVNGVFYGGFAGSNPVGVVSVGSTGSERQLTNVAAGQVTATSTDAVNGSQLYVVASQVANVNTSIITLQNGSSGMFQVSPDANTTAPSPTGTSSVAGGNGAVASGNSSVAIGDNSSATGASSTALGNGAQATANGGVAIGAGSIADRTDSVSVGSSGNTRAITHVSAGTDTTDAVNVGQLKSGISTAENWAKNYTDQQLQHLNQNVSRIGNRANAGIAGAMAMAGLPQAYLPGKNMVAAAASSFHGEQGIAIGLSTISESGRWVYKLDASDNTRGDAGVAIGAGMQW